MADDSSLPATDVLPPPLAASAAPVLRSNGQRVSSGEKLTVAAYDFRQPLFLSEQELARLRLAQEDFIRYLSARLSLFLRMELSLQFEGLTLMPFVKFTAALAHPTPLTLFKAEPLLGVGILALPSPLALTIADRLLGGRGATGQSARALTEIEVALLEDVTQLMLEEWANQWQHEQALQPLIIGHESNGDFLQTSAAQTSMLVLTLAARFGECHEQLQFAVPYSMLEPLLKKRQGNRSPASTNGAKEQAPAWQPAYDAITVPVRAEWPAFELSLREIFSLRVGDVLEMPAAQLQNTHVLLNGTLKFSGSVGLEAERIALKLIKPLTSGDLHYGNSDG
jgi:flagellar motor switch protein FliM